MNYRSDESDIRYKQALEQNLQILFGKNAVANVSGHMYFVVQGCTNLYLVKTTSGGGSFRWCLVFLPRS